MTKILLVEDDPAIAESLSVSLRAWDFEVTVARTIKAGRQALAAGKFELHILDVRLPDGTGFELCREIREAGLRGPVIMLTAQTDEASAVQGLAAGADDYVRKPFGVNELVARMRRLLLRDVTGEKILSFGEVRVNPELHKAYFGEHEMALTRREFDILHLLVKRGGGVLSRDEILAILDEEGETNDRTIARSIPTSTTSARSSRRPEGIK